MLGVNERTGVNGVNERMGVNGEKYRRNEVSEWREMLEECGLECGLERGE
jgi:hypothetical protein